MSNPLKHNGAPVMAQITEIKQETPNVRTFTFQHTLNSNPGQFIMLWVPGVDQKPFSIGNDSGDTFQLTIFELGGATQEVFKKKVGDRLGITGPFGTAYSYTPGDRVVTVGGGYGAAPLGYLAEQAIADGCTVDFITGARSAEHVLFEQRAREAGATTHISTDDGSAGTKGYVTDNLLPLLEKLASDGALDHVSVHACGPEVMQKAVAKICLDFGVKSEVSLERYMKCGFGVCGNCCIDDDGRTTCQQGPVVPGELALDLAEFGNYHRDKMGIRHDF